MIIAMPIKYFGSFFRSKGIYASSSSGDYEEIDVQDQFYDAIAAASSSSEDEDSDDDDGELDKKVFSTFFLLEIVFAPTIQKRENK